MQIIIFSLLNGIMIKLKSLESSLETLSEWSFTILWLSLMLIDEVSILHVLRILNVATKMLLFWVLLECQVASVVSVYWLRDGTYRVFGLRIWESILLCGLDAETTLLLGALLRNHRKVFWNKAIDIVAQFSLRIATRKLRPVSFRPGVKILRFEWHGMFILCVTLRWQNVNLRWPQAPQFLQFVWFVFNDWQYPIVWIAVEV